MFILFLKTRFIVWRWTHTPTKETIKDYSFEKTEPCYFYKIDDFLHFWYISAYIMFPKETLSSDNEYFLKKKSKL